MKALKIFLAIFLILGLGISMLYIFANTFNMTYKVLDCEGGYSSRLFEKEENLTFNNAKADVGICLCEKYMIKKDIVYEKEVLKMFLTHRPIMTKDHIANAKVIKVDSICKYRSDIFIKMYNM